jgi:hypothetical protein
MGILSTTKIRKENSKGKIAYILVFKKLLNLPMLKCYGIFYVKMKLQAYGAIPFQMLVDIRERYKLAE